ncbi:MAG TPA: hypothetical protein VK716_07045 [Terracidiphilus sp.]|jgi:hypothetical protein|nr:hypothetical protein [Terracidiphilus sp.]
MQWLVIGLLVSLVALLLAVAGLARHIRLQRARLRSQQPAEAPDTAEETDLESEP